MQKLKTIGLIAGSVSALVALIGLAINLATLNANSKKDRIKQWQAVIVYSIIEKETSSGAHSAMKIEALKSKYLDAAQQFADYEMPKSSISDEALQWVILDLVSRRAIVPLPGRSYRVAFEPFMMRDPALEVSSRLQAVSEKVMFYARTEPSRYTVEQLAAKLVPEFPLTTTDQIQMVINDGLGFKQIFIDKDNKITASQP